MHLHNTHSVSSSFPEFTEHSFTTLDLVSRRVRGNRQELAFLSQDEDRVEGEADTLLSHWTEGEREVPQDTVECRG